MADQHDPASGPLETVCRMARAMFSVSEAAVHRRGAPSPSGAARACLPLIEQWCLGDADLEDGCLVVEDVAAEPRWAGQASGLLACAPIGGREDPGTVTVCLSDPRPRPFTAEERRRLADLAALAAELMTAEARVAAATQQADFFRLLAENSTDTLVRGNLDGVRLYISPAVRTLLGYEPEEMIGRRAREIVHPDDAEAFAELMALVRSGQIEVASSEQRQRHRDGHWVWMEAFVRLTRDRLTGEADGYVASVRDISRRKEAEARLFHSASHDPLTGLANRVLFRERLGQEIARSRRTGTHFALFWLDLDRFKDVNDRLGHEAGDVVLRVVAERLRSVVRTEDTVARIGGDEFVILRVADGTEAGAAAAEDLAARLIEATRQPIDYAGVPVRVGLSIGAALTAVEGFETDRLLRVADMALYRAKNAGRGRAVVSG